MEVDIFYPKSFQVLFDRSFAYYGFHGGRGGAKSFDITQFFAQEALSRKMRLFCTREVQKSLRESVFYDIMKHGKKMAGNKAFRPVESKSIIEVENGSLFIFSGLKDHNADSMKSLSNIDLTFVEEAHSISKRSWDLLLPTVMRVRGARLVCAWNPENRNDPVDRFFRGKTLPPRAVVVQVNWRDNPFFPEELEELRRYCETEMPEDYNHIWEGGYKTDAGVKKVLPYEKLMLCVDAHLKLGYQPKGRHHVGFDPADEGEDRCSLACRQGPLLWYNEDWSGKGSALHESSGKVFQFAVKHGAQFVYYDASGLGAGVKSDFNRLQISRKPPFAAKAFLFGNPVKGKDTEYLKGVKNSDFFSKQNAQAWWNLRLRMENTIKALSGEKINLAKCLFIDSNIPNLTGLLTELSQVVYDTDTRDGEGQIKVIKKPDDDDPSPDRGDSTVMAYAHDIRNGLKAR